MWLSCWTPKPRARGLKHGKGYRKSEGLTYSNSKEAAQALAGFLHPPKNYKKLGIKGKAANFIYIEDSMLSCASVGSQRDYGRQVGPLMLDDCSSDGLDSIDTYRTKNVLLQHDLPRQVI